MLMSGQPRVVIIGGGFAGLEAMKALAKTRAEITLLDRRNHHCFQPLLYQVATAALSPAEIAWPIRAIAARQANTRVLMADVTGIDVAGRRVLAGPMSYPYDHLIVATGVTHSYFGHAEWETVAPGLKSIEDATTLRRRLLLAFEQAELAEDDAERKRLLTFVIVGGGPTGVEMAGAVAEVARHALAGEFRRIDPRSARIVLVEGGPRVLPAFPESLSAYAQTALERMGVEVQTATTVRECDTRGVSTDKGRIEAATLVWAAGVQATPVADWTQAERDRAGRVKVNRDLSLPGRPEIFVIGDVASVQTSDGKPVPGIAPAAKQMGRYVGKLVAARIAGQAPTAPFTYRHYGELATVGRKAAVVSFGRIRIRGFIGWLFWCVAHVYFLIGVRNRFVVAFSWLWNYVTWQRGARLITSGDSPQFIAR
jgi:NADH dehydrogenase